MGTKDKPPGREKGAKAPLRAVLDTNVYVAAYLSRNPRSPNKELFWRWRDSQFVLLVSKAILEEVVEKFGELDIDQQLTLELVSHILADAEYVQVSEGDVQPIILADPDDDHVLACAVVGRADCLVTYDPHFDCLGGEYQSLKILDGLHFLYVVRGDSL
ncbi:MAG: putative toxin-antitoxin system toxin component, PIN family [Anaerolineales bacterium]|nr:putative toxin-antitoxin system toxin component, PIN family [Anaerolineales bacterium]